MDTQQEKQRTLLELQTAIGFELLQLLPQLKVDKLGRINTNAGIKSVSGLGACILAIVESERTRLSE